TGRTSTPARSWARLRTRGISTVATSVVSKFGMTSRSSSCPRICRRHRWTRSHKRASTGNRSSSPRIADRLRAERAGKIAEVGETIAVALGTVAATVEDMIAVDAVVTTGMTAMTEAGAAIVAAAEVTTGTTAAGAAGKTGTAIRAPAVR